MTGTADAVLDGAPGTSGRLGYGRRRRVTGGYAAQEAPWLEHVLRCAAGDHTALAALYDQSSRMVYSLVMAIVRNSADAEEVTVDVYTQVWQRASRYDASRGTVGAWLVTMARSRAVDRMRMRRLPEGSATPDVNPPPTVDQGRSPYALAELTEWRGRIGAALQELPPGERDLVVLAFFQGFTHSELAARLEQPLGTVKTRLRRGLLKLRTHLGSSKPVVKPCH